MTIAERRFRPGFQAAFDAWRATKPETNPNAPRGPTYMPGYRQPGLRTAAAFDKQADESFAEGEDAGHEVRQVHPHHGLPGERALPGRHLQLLPAPGGRYALVGLGAVLLVISFVLLLQLPGPPT